MASVHRTTQALFYPADKRQLGEHMKGEKLRLREMSHRHCMTRLPHNVCTGELPRHTRDKAVCPGCGTQMLCTSHMGWVVI